jgi:hypothetical protein
MKIKILSELTKKIPFCLFCIMLFANSYSQGLKSLDNAFGISKFKLKSSFDVYKKDLKYFDTNKQGIEFYTYTKGDVLTLFGQDVKSINLGYVNNKLYTISINLGSLDKKQNMALLEKLKELYSTPEIILPNNDLIYVAKWETGKVYMQAQEYSCSHQVIPCETEVFIYSKEIKKTL